MAELCVGGRRCGDLVRRRSDGLLEFAAPVADPLETVAAMRDVAGVQDAVVTERVDAVGGSAVVGYVADAGATVDLDRLRQHLVTRLPASQIPTGFELLRRLPLTPEGHHDLAALAGDPCRGREPRPLAAFDLPQWAPHSRDNPVTQRPFTLCVRDLLGQTQMRGSIGGCFYGGTLR